MPSIRTTEYILVAGVDCRTTANQTLEVGLVRYLLDDDGALDEPLSEKVLVGEATFAAVGSSGYWTVSIAGIPGLMSAWGMKDYFDVANGVDNTTLQGWQQTIDKMFVPKN